MLGTAKIRVPANACTMYVACKPNTGVKRLLEPGRKLTALSRVGDVRVDDPRSPCALRSPAPADARSFSLRLTAYTEAEKPSSDPGARYSTHDPTGNPGGQSGTDA